MSLFKTDKINVQDGDLKGSLGSASISPSPTSPGKH